jgi:hypothetical protein
MGNITKLDFEQLRTEIRELKYHPRRKLMYLLRDELILIDHWKANKRGNPVKAYNSRGKNTQS